MKKEAWSKPELIVLLRNHPEETLQAVSCKHPGATYGPGNLTGGSCNDNTIKCKTSAIGS